MNTNGSMETNQGHPPDLKPPGKKLPADSSPNPGVRPVTVLLAITLLIIIAGVVLFIFPRFLADLQNPVVLSSEPVEETRSKAPEPMPASDSSDNTQSGSAAARSAAAAKLETFVALKVQAERENTSRWAEKPYQEILQLEASGDLAFTEQDYPGAEEAYDSASAELESLLGSKTEMFNGFLQDGFRFLLDEKSEDALHSFNLALAIEPDNQEARAGAERARNLDAVLALYKNALADEQSGDFAAAQNTLEALQQLDNNFVPAQILLEKVEKNYEKQQFTEQMSHFYADLESGDLKGAREVLATIKQTRGEHPEVIQAESLLVTKEETVLVATLKKQAETQSSGEQWQTALATYLQILAIAPDALFAVNGHDRASKRVELDQALQDSLSKPGRLQEDTQLETAKRLLDYARQFTPAGVRLSTQIDQLASLVARASTPVPVVLRSDNMTDIVIYHVGKMGSFYTRQISLKPGKYTIVGSRRGFRDLRTIIEVDPEKAENQLFIACQEPI